MSVTLTARIDAALGGDYATVILADGPSIYWRLNETTGTTAYDASANGTRDGTINGSPVRGIASPIPSGQTGYTFDDVDDYVRLLAYGPPVWVGAHVQSLEAWVWLAPAGAGSVRVIWGTNDQSVEVGVDAAEKVYVSQKAVWTLTDATARTASTWYHVAVTSDGTNTRIFINGTQVATTANIAGETWTDLILGGFGTGPINASFNGRLDEAAYYGSELSAARVLAHYTAGLWTSLGTDVLLPVHCHYGLAGNGPTDCVADTGELAFDLDNSAENSGATLGWYSPAHASVRTNWAYGIPVRWVITYAGTDYIRFAGKVGSIMPDPGLKRARRVHVVAYDVMRDLTMTSARDVAIQINQLESQLLDALLDALPACALMFGRSIQAGLDTFPYAFDQVRGGQPVAGAARDVVLSALGVLYSTGAGVLTYKNRHTRAVAASAMSLNNDMIDVVVPATMDGVYNRVRVTVHPKTIDAAATTVLWSQTGGAAAAPQIAAGATLTLWGSYYDPSDVQTPIGGTAQVAPVATTDYTANDAADGSGTDRTASLTVVASAFASTVKFVLSNTFSAAIFVTSLRIRGKGIYDNGPRTFESYTVKPYGDQQIDIEMRYQDDDALGQSAATYVDAQYNTLTRQADRVEFVATTSAARAVQALTREPTDVVTVTETVTGLAAVDVVIQRVTLEWTNSQQLLCQWGLAPSAPWAFWQVGTAGASELGTTTTLGF